MKQVFIFAFVAVFAFTPNAIAQPQDHDAFMDYIEAEFEKCKAIPAEQDAKYTACSNRVQAILKEEREGRKDPVEEKYGMTRSELLQDMKKDLDAQEKRLKPFNPQKAQPQYDAQAELQKMMKQQQQQNAAQQAARDAQQQGYHDMISGNGQGGSNNANAQTAQNNSGQKPAGFDPGNWGDYNGSGNSGISPTPRGSRDALEGLRAGNPQQVQPNQKKPQYTKYCSCEGGDTLSYGSMCMGGPSGRSGTYPLGNYAWTPECKHETYN